MFLPGVHLLPGASSRTATAPRRIGTLESGRQRPGAGIPARRQRLIARREQDDPSPEEENMKSCTRAFLILAAITLLGSGVAAAADAYTIDTAHSNVTFEIRHLMSKVNGTFDDFGGTFRIDWEDPSASTVEFTIDAASINTRNEKRDEHLRSDDFFDVANHPTITFVSTEIVKTEGNSYQVHGDLTMHGVTRKVVLPVTFLGEVVDPWGNTKAGFEVETEVNRKDYDIVWNKTLETGGMILGDEVEIDIDLQMAKQQ
jgi:polyisoprenoid-binding protein YceI